MIIDQLDNILFYERLLPYAAEGMAKVKELGSAPQVGRYEFPGGYLMVQKGETKPMDEGTFEAHRKYIDVQILLEGCEEVAWKPLTQLSTAIPYDETKDAQRLDGTKEHHMLISAGMFYAAFPADGHKPVSHIEEKHEFTKIVMKLPAE